MAHNPFNDLYVDSLDEVTREARRVWQMAAAICYGKHHVSEKNAAPTSPDVAATPTQDHPAETGLKSRPAQEK